MVDSGILMRYRKYVIVRPPPSYLLGTRDAIEGVLGYTNVIQCPSETQKTKSQARKPDLVNELYPQFPMGYPPL